MQWINIKRTITLLLLDCNSNSVSRPIYGHENSFLEFLSQAPIPNSPKDALINMHFPWLNTYFCLYLGNYTVLTGTFKFSRLMGFAILQVYIPCISIVFVSWISLWINKTCIPARVGKWRQSRALIPFRDCSHIIQSSCYQSGRNEPIP